MCVCMVPPAHFVVMRGSCTENGPVEIPTHLGAGRTEGEGTDRTVFVSCLLFLTDNETGEQDGDSWLPFAQTRRDQVRLTESSMPLWMFPRSV